MGEEILPLDQSRVIEQANSTYFPSGKALEKQTKAIKGKVEKHLLDTDHKSIAGLYSKYFFI